MKFSTILATLATVVLSVQALPQTLVRRNGSSGSGVNALSPEFLAVATAEFSSSFYDNINKCNESSFINAGFARHVWKEYLYIAERGKQFKEEIIKALGTEDSALFTPTILDFLTYNPYSTAVRHSTNVDFTELVNFFVLEEFAVAKFLLRNTAGASWNGDFDLNLSLEQALALIAPSISSSSPTSPSVFSSLSPLSISQTGDLLTLQFDNTRVDDGETAIVAFIMQKEQVLVHLEKDKVEIPAGVSLAQVALVTVGKISLDGVPETITVFSIIAPSLDASEL